MSTSTPTSTSAAPLLDGSSSGHSTPASYTHHPSNSHHEPGTSTPNSSSSIDLSSLSTHPIYTAMFPDPDLPIANISRIMKRSLPENVKIAKDAKECVQDCVSELISFITSEASDKCAAEKRKTINGDDILYAMRVLGFDNYEEVLRVYLSRYRMEQENNPKARKRAAPTSRAAKEDDDDDRDDEDPDEDDADQGAAASNVGSGFNSPSFHHLNPQQ